MKEKFYVFLDIDGVLWDWDVLDEMGQSTSPNGSCIDLFCKSSVEALQFLCDELQKQYEIDLVITSSGWDKLNELVPLLHRHGFAFPKETHTTRFIDRKRTLEIQDYLQDKKNAQNYVIVDDETIDIKEHFNCEQIITTNIFHNCLKKSQVETFLNNWVEKQEEPSR